jgi:ATP-dependent Clp protease ATP-binding subunit ClpA/ATP-dependent Clp protease ATP-binding subunit ClpC
MIDFTVGVYVRRLGTGDQWVALAPVGYVAYEWGDSEPKLRERTIDKLRQNLRRAPPAIQELFQLPLGTELVRVPIDVKTTDGRIHGNVPLIVEPRWSSEHGQHFVAYHPLHRELWFACDDRADLELLANLAARAAWSERAKNEDDDDDDDEVALSDGKDRLVQIAFSCEPQSLIDTLPSKQKDPRQAAASTRSQRVLHELGVDETHARAQGTALPLGVPRSPYRERLAFLLSGPKPRSVAVVGAPGSGKTTIVRQWIADRLAEDGHPIHKNLDKVHHVWRLSGKRVIAGMSAIGQWEERCLSILEEAQRRRCILWIEDLHLFGRLGQSRQSERSFADFFRGPVRRGDLAIVAELTPEQHARLERDAPGLAEALALVALPPASAAETAQLLLHEVRALEADSQLVVHPFVARTAIELGAALFPWRVRPGVAIEIVQRVAAETKRAKHGEVTPHAVLDYLARTTGLSSKLLALDAPLDADEVEASFAARVIGQPVATRAAADVVLRVRAGLADPSRPVAVLLFTGPTGTGKTELATAIAEYLYGDPDRLVRIDMGELTGGDAVARLIGDRWNPDGLLTSRVRAQPFCVVLLDEIEKAHPQALHLLLQLFDEGRLTDAAGEVASFASAVVVMTSNLGARNAQPIGFGDARDRVLADIARAVREFFPVELFNRIDRVVPFQPLTEEVAAKVVDKELGKLLARRGLRERDTFVKVGAAVKRRAVADAFDARYGARTVKRWLEDRVAGTLVDLLASAPPARLRVVRLGDDRGEIVAELEPMAERAATPGRYVLEGALDVATAALEPAIASAIAALARVRGSGAIERGRRDATNEVRYFVDDLAGRLEALEQLFGVEPEPEQEPDLRYERRLIRDHGGDHRSVRFRSAARPSRRPIASRDALIAGIAESLLVERALPALLDPEAHAVTLVLSRVGAVHGDGLTAVMQVFANNPAWADSAATADDTGAINTVTIGKKGTSTFADWQAWWRKQRDIAIVTRGLFVREALAHEHGTWLLRAAAAEPDVVRVEVRPGAPREPADVLRAHLAARAELDRVLELGGALPANPDVLLPVTRTVSTRASLWWSARPLAIDVEDFATGWIDRTTAKDLPAAVRRSWYLAWSRTS